LSLPLLLLRQSLQDKYILRSFYAQVLVCDDTGISAKDEPVSARK